VTQHPNALQGSLADIAFCSGYDDVHRILLQKEALANKTICCAGDLAHILTVISIAFFQRESRIAICEPLSFRFRERYVLARESAVFSFSKRLAPKSPAGVRCYWDFNIGMTNTRDIVPIDICLRYQTV
jgi:hypothetical protein